MTYDNHFTPLAESLNLVGGFGFLAGAVWFYKSYYYSLDVKFLLFANYGLLFSASGIIFDFSEIWNFQWWLWHGTRFCAHLLSLLIIFVLYRNIEKEKDVLLSELKEALQNIKVLKGFLPICASCKKIRDDNGYWNQIESYIKEHSEAEFSHGICPECAERLYPELYRHK